ncbi:zf-HC2 domain-containing protein [Micromonospora sp. NPDC051300]|uniref:zf-HC2 domain-containing protein n=1 Tax=Micromonospora sp. NPDC051300 TaxID=3364286 RepID=UPI00379277BE
MTGFHVAAGVLAAYAEGGLADMDAWSVEAHLDGCVACRTSIAPDASTASVVEAVAVSRRDMSRTGCERQPARAAGGRIRRPCRVGRPLPSWTSAGGAGGRYTQVSPSIRAAAGSGTLRWRSS